MAMTKILPPSSDPRDILGISTKTIDELDRVGITIDSVTKDSMLFHWPAEMPIEKTTAIKKFVKKRIGRRCRISYVTDMDQPKPVFMVLQRIYSQ